MVNRQRMIQLRARRRRESAQRRLLIERLGDRRVLAAITGTVFEDADDSFRQEAAETALADRLVYLDSNANGAFDTGERFTTSDSEGNFSFTGLATGSYLLRLFDGTESQQPTFPVEAVVSESSIAVEQAHQVASGVSGPIALTAGQVVVGDLETGTGSEISVGSDLLRMQTLPGGDLLVIGGDGSGETAWRVNPESGTPSAVDLAPSGESSIVWSDVAIDAQGRGVLLEQASGESTVRAIDASDPEAGIQVVATDTQVPSGAQALASSSGPRSVIAWPGSDGLSVALWSNVTGSPIDTSSGSSGELMVAGSAVELAGTTELLAFDDDSGLLAVRSADGGVSVHDVDANFAVLHDLPDVTGPVAFDAARDLLMTVSPVDSALKLIDLRDGSMVAEMAVDLSSVGTLSALAPSRNNDAVVVLGAAGMTELSLTRPTAHSVVLSDDQAAANVHFGVHLSDDNEAPVYEVPPSFTIAEDSELEAAAPAALSGSQDADGDSYVLLQTGPASHGVAVVSPDGAVNYSPNPDFAGTERIAIALHDGRSMTTTWLEITVTSVPDAPTALNLNIPPISEHVQPGTAVGSYQVVDADAENDHQVSLSDPRLSAREGQVYFEGGTLNYEDEWQFPLTATVADPATGTELSQDTTVSVADANDPITGIRPDTAFVFENAPGDVIAELVVEDEDAEPIHVFSVDDERFVVEFGELRLAEEVALDHETDPTVVVQVTASDPTSGDEFTEAITIIVKDLPEQHESIELSDDEVVEFEPGYVVASVTVDGEPGEEKYTLSVDDSRFEIVEGTLKLVDGIWVERANQSQIQLEITAEDAEQQFEPITETFVIDVVENATPYHNDRLPHDVNGNEEVSAADALSIINYLNTYGPGPVGHGDPGFFYDVNGDGMVTALDALLVINEINRSNLHGDGPAVGGEKGEGELPAPGASQLIADAPAAPQQSTDIAITELDSEAKLAGHGDEEHSAPEALDPADHASPRDSRETYAAKVDDTLRLLSQHTS